VVLGVVLGRRVGVMGGVDAVAVRDMGMMAGLFLVAGFMVPRGFSVVMGGVFVMLRRARMVFVVRLAHRFLHEVGNTRELVRIA
jgi:galactitol-specific phosphotransferase system IIC component